MKSRILFLLGLTMAYVVVPTPVYAQNVGVFEGDAEVNTELKKMIAAYDKLGEFRVTSLDTVSNFSSSEQTPVLRTRAFGRIGKNDRAAIKVEKLNAKGQMENTLLVALNDGVYFYESEKGLPGSTTLLVNLKGDMKQRAGLRFFLASPGLRALSVILQTKTFALPKNNVYGDISLEKLKNGDSQIQVEGGIDDKEVSFDFKFLIGKNGFLKRVETRFTNNGNTDFFDSLLSTPVALNSANDFKWSSVMPNPKR